MNKWITGILLVAVALAALLVYSRHQMLDAEPDAIVGALFGNIRSEAIIDALDRHDTVNGYSDRHRLSMVSAATASSRYSVLQWLLDNGADPNPSRGRHPLFIAVKYKDEKAADILLRAGSDLDAQAENGQTIRQWCEKEWPELLPLCRENGIVPPASP